MIFTNNLVHTLKWFDIHCVIFSQLLFFQTRVIIKISTQPFYSINLNWLSFMGIKQKDRWVFHFRKFLIFLPIIVGFTTMSHLSLGCVWNMLIHKLMILYQSSFYAALMQSKPSLKIGSVNKALLFWYWQRLKKKFL